MFIVSAISVDCCIQKLGGLLAGIKIKIIDIFYFIYLFNLILTYNINMVPIIL